MTASSPPPTDPAQPKPESLPRFDPPSLRRFAPARVEVTDDAGRPLRMTGKYVHIRAGAKIRVQVVPQVPRDREPAHELAIAVSNSLRWVDRPHDVVAGQVTTVVAVVQSRRWGKLPVPKRAEVTVSSGPPGAERCRQVVSLVVWPSVWAVVGWVLTAVVVGLFSVKFFEAAKTRPPFDAIVHVLTDLAFLGQTALLGGGLSLLVHLVSWVLIWLGVVAPDAE